ncbi:polysaccharide chain length determinant protein, PEP-CTERM locus subfamily [Cognatiyoonia koreensis]|uniref:Polysaccharide chain length determinant protein, PEP-CTERM locus subfamily n=1 Tax=Cognatiyoonia koreensis TaxID=364200 RepID=A0A1I0RSV6_9RHOB|nr:chain length-determining protein [Cognatiyoonia koreensis]SEW44255.1 polysaccharide chain length determinant protein, PEP-CTERM locus subfamily [Cognatiyoonia koreensis]
MNLDFRFYWKLFLRRFPVMAALFILCAGLGVFTAIRLPETYQSTARLVVDEPQIPEWMVSTTVETGTIEELDIIQQRLMTRANLIDIANRFKVYPEMRTINPDQIVARMNEDTRINRTAGRDRATLLTISFSAGDPQTSANVVNEYVTLVLEANTDFRMSRADDTLEFFEEEVDRLARELDLQSIRIAEFKSENSGALPENQTYRLGRQSLLQERLSQLERDLRSTQSQREDIERIFQATGSIGNRMGGQRTTPEEQQLIVARADLELALSTYTAQNPRVIRLQSAVDRLESIVAAQKASVQTNEDGGTQLLTAEEAIFTATISEMDNRIETTTAEIERTRQELEDLQDSIIASSANGIQLNALERDYEILQTRYNAAVANLNEAQVSERIETTGQGRRITVIESAVPPSSPSGPSRPRIAMMGAMVGMALAGGFFVLLELLNRTVRRPAELVSKFGVTPIATIPYMESRSRRIARRTTLVGVSLAVLIGGPLALWYIDTNYMPLDLIVRAVLARLNIG